MVHDGSVPKAIDSFLQFVRRPHEGKSLQGYLQEIARRVFAVYHRLCCGEEQGAPPKKQRPKLLAISGIIGLPQLMDIAVLYGPASPEMTKALLLAASDLVPGFSRDVESAGKRMADNLATLYESCLSGAIDERGDAVRYFVDACMSISLFCDSLPFCAGPLLRGAEGRLFMLAAALYEASSHWGSNESRLRAAIVTMVRSLLQNGVFSGDALCWEDAYRPLQAFCEGEGTAAQVLPEIERQSGISALAERSVHNCPDAPHDACEVLRSAFGASRRRGQLERMKEVLPYYDETALMERLSARDGDTDQARHIFTSLVTPLNSVLAELIRFPMPCRLWQTF